MTLDWVDLVVILCVGIVTSAAIITACMIAWDDDDG